jgi:ethanolamine ammonia-lyase large subunit
MIGLLGAAGVNYIMGVPGADDVMLSYQRPSFHDAQYVRQVLGLRPAPEFEEWLEKMEVMRRDLKLNHIDQRHRLLGGVRSQIGGA